MGDVDEEIVMGYSDCSRRVHRRGRADRMDDLPAPLSLSS